MTCPAGAFTLVNGSESQELGSCAVLRPAGASPPESQNCVERFSTLQSCDIIATPAMRRKQKLLERDSEDGIRRYGDTHVVRRSGRGKRQRRALNGLTIHDLVESRRGRSEAR